MGGEQPRLRAALDDIPEYRAGQAPAAREDIETFKVSSNENPYPPLPIVLEAIAAVAARMNRYPDPASTELVAALAAFYDVPGTHIALGTGAVALCYQVAHSTAEVGDEIIYAWRSFEAYPIVTRVAGASAVEVPLTDTDHHDLDAMASAITDRTRLIFVCSPNNPTGTTVAAKGFASFMAKVPRDVVVVLDEAYAEFARDPEGVDGLKIYGEYPNLVVLRTFSKAYGLAGLRVGYAIGAPSIIAALRKTALPFGISVVAQAAAVASLSPEASRELASRVDALVQERTRVIAGLRAAGWVVADSHANFVWLDTGERTTEVAAAFEAAGLTVRPFAGEGVRITIAETDANDRIIDVAATLLPPV